MLPRPVTLRDVARKVGVSHVTVSLALRNHPRISPERRQEILRAVKEMNYVPDPLFGKLAAYRHNLPVEKIHSSIAWINHWDQPDNLLNKYREFMAYWKGATAAAAERGYRLEEFRWLPELSARRFEQILFTRGIRGVLIPPHLVPPDWGNFNWNKFSIVRFGGSVPTPDSNLVTSDQYRSTTMAVGKISRYGYRRIGLVAGNRFDQRLGGVYQSGFQWGQNQLKAANHLPPLLLEADDYLLRPDASRRELECWLKENRPDAIFTTEMRLPRLIEELGYRIPRDIAVAGASIDVPVSAGVNQNSEAIGRIAVELLLKQINFNECGEPPTPSRTLVEGFWRDGDSLPKRRP
ncbi:MAG TPA: LacI family DNA-binding transcriptional regulator [Verrucomicrobiae bacterium]